jgi:hypothetical protein
VPACAERNPRLAAGFLKFSSAAVDELKVGHSVIAYPKVHQPVVIDVRCNHTHAFPRWRAIPDSLLTSVKVPSPLLWNSQLGLGE